MKRRSSEDVGKLIVDGINEQLRLHGTPIRLIFTEVVVCKEDNSAGILMQFGATNLNVVLPFVDWSSWCRLTLMEPIDYRWYGEMEALTRQMIDLWNENVHRITWSLELDRLLLKDKEHNSGTEE
jgi:hypothetical protein